MKNMNTIQSPLHLTENNFENEVLRSDKPVLVDFWAEWCAPCKAMNPVIEDLAKEYGDQLKVAKVNIDESNDLAAQFNIRSIPAFLFFKEGKVVAELIGAASKATLKAKIGEQILT
jgi:thioredoxin 1